jgi:hypothetical protein
VHLVRLSSFLFFPGKIMLCRPTVPSKK